MGMYQKVATIKITWIQDGEQTEETQNIHCAAFSDHYVFHNNLVGELEIKLMNFDMAIDVVKNIMLEQGTDFLVVDRLPDLSPAYSVEYLIAENAALKAQVRDLLERETK